MSSSFKDELLLMITEQDSPVIRTDWLTLKLNVKKEKVAKALLELKQEGDIFFIIIEFYPIRTILSIKIYI